MKYIFFISIILFMVSCTSKAEDIVYVLPDGYIGKVIIIYDQVSGDGKAYEGRKRLCNINGKGVLKTLLLITSYRSFPEVYYNNGGKIVKIPVVADLFEADNN